MVLPGVAKGSAVHLSNPQSDPRHADGGSGHDDLSQLLTDAAETRLPRFAISLRRDYDAIHAASTSPWTTSPVEGHVCRIKMLKRSMYGRAGFELLRARVLNLE